MNLTYERPSWSSQLKTSRLNSPRRKLMAMSAVGILAMGIGIPIANAAEGDPELTLSNVDGLVVVVGESFAGGASVALAATVEGGSGSGTVTSKSDGSFVAAFEPPETYKGQVAVNATAGDKSAAGTITVNGSTSSDGLPSTGVTPGTDSSSQSTTTTTAKASTTTTTARTDGSTTTTSTKAPTTTTTARTNSTTSAAQSV